jgi:hypothetical protein
MIRRLPAAVRRALVASVALGGLVFCTAASCGPGGGAPTPAEAPVVTSATPTVGRSDDAPGGDGRGSDDSGGERRGGDG